MACTKEIKESALLTVCPEDATEFLLVNADETEFQRITWGVLKVCVEILNQIKIIYNGNFTIAMPTDSLFWGLVIKPATPATIRVGTAAGLDDIVADTAVPTTGRFIMFPHFSTQAVTYYVTGAVANTIVVQVKNFIKLT